MKIRRPLIIIAIALFVLLVALPVMAQQGEPCTTCPVSFDTPSVLDPASDYAAESAKLFWFVFWIATGVFVLVETLLIVAVFRFRNRPASEAVQIHGNTKLEILWTSIPALILVVLLGFTLRSMAVIRAPVKGEPLKVVAVGHQWWWEFQYPDLGVITANQMIVPVGQPIEMELRSVDVQHGFWAPQLFGKMDAVPGRTNRMSFTVTEAGEYGAQCTQMCGEQHAQMRFQIIATPAGEFQTWAAGQQQVPPPPEGEAAVRGQEIFLLRCSACHTVGGTVAAGRVGPNLTHVSGRDFIAGGIMPRTDDNLRQWVQNAPSFKPGTLMPDFSIILSPQDMTDIVAYLSTLK
ncbi:MAG: cytochrome c oxidase subunit II [Chloroflexi bacterium]|nr:cytochrome c oxidase subunit II [Chloroflexota bacterium]